MKKLTGDNLSRFCLLGVLLACLFSYAKLPAILLFISYIGIVYKDTFYENDFAVEVLICSIYCFSCIIFGNIGLHVFLVSATMLCLMLDFVMSDVWISDTALQLKPYTLVYPMLDNIYKMTEIIKNSRTVLLNTSNELTNIKEQNHILKAQISELVTELEKTSSSQNISGGETVTSSTLLQKMDNTYVVDPADSIDRVLLNDKLSSLCETLALRCERLEEELAAVYNSIHSH